MRLGVSTVFPVTEPPLHQRFWQLLKVRKARDWKRPLFGVIALSLVLLATTWSVTWLWLDKERALLDSNSRAYQESLAIIISENFNQVLDRGRFFSMASSEWFDGNSADAAKRLSAMLSENQVFLRLALYDQSSQQVFASSPDTDSSQLTAAIRDHLSNPVAAVGLQLVPWTNPMERAWHVQMLLPINGRENKPRGVLLVVLDLGYVLGLYREVDIGRTGAIQILQSNGSEVLRVRQGGLEYTQAGLKTEFAMPNSGSQDSLITDYFGDGHSYLVSYKHVAKYPFLVAVSRDLAELQAAHNVSRSRSQWFLWLFTAFITLATFLIAKSLRAREKMFDALRKANLENRSLIMELEDQRYRALELASHDALTALPNRRLFLEMGQSHLSRAKRSHKLYGLMYVDLDRFKNINDTLGHHVGDLLLQTVATRLQSALRESDVVARMGGDEFTVLLNELDSLDDMVMVANKIIDLISRPCTNLDGHDIQVSPSIGIAVYPQDGYNVETLCQHADAAMYQSKRAGRGRYTFYDPALNPVSDRQFSLEQRLPTAIAEGELVLHYQPKVRLSDFKIVGLEALVRWQHPDFGLIYPAEFIPMAELTGIDVALGDWVASCACQQLAQWQASGLNPVPVAINVTALQLTDLNFPQRLSLNLASCGIPADLLEVEIIESCLMQSIEVATTVLTELARSGIRIALDDFGNGYSSLTYIRTLPIHTIKIDRAFVKDLRNSPQDATIVDSIVTMAQKLHLQVVAEGVELIDQLLHLKSINCDQAQGYFLSRPVDAAAAGKLIQQSILNLPP